MSLWWRVFPRPFREVALDDNIGSSLRYAVGCNDLLGCTCPLPSQRGNLLADGQLSTVCHGAASLFEIPCLQLHANRASGWGGNCGFLYRKRRPNRYRGSHGQCRARLWHRRQAASGPRRAPVMWNIRTPESLLDGSVEGGHPAAQSNIMSFRANPQIDAKAAANLWPSSKISRAAPPLRESCPIASLR